MDPQKIEVWRRVRLEYALHVTQCDDPACQAEALYIAALSMAYLDATAEPAATPVGEA